MSVYTYTTNRCTPHGL